MKIRYLIYIILFISISCTHKDEQTQYLTQQISVNWFFKSTSDSIWLPAIIPGCVHTDLMNNKIIDDPYHRLVEHDIQWIDKQDWEYKTTFEINDDLLNHDAVEIVFEGLDTYTDIFINDSLILSTDNMFLSWKLNCKKILRPGNNNLKIIFKSPINIGINKRKNLGYMLPGGENDQSELGGLGDTKVAAYSRKPGYHFGWDWGPRLVTSGIWQDITIKAWNKARMTGIQIVQQDVTDSIAQLEAQIEIEAAMACEISLFYDIDSGTKHQERVSLKEGYNNVIIPFSINNPELWWTNGLGDQQLYNINFTLSDDSGILSIADEKIGIRTLEIIQESDSIGKSFYIELNGHPVFMKGANYIPQDMFLNRVSTDDYEYLIRSAVDANMNMLRVWGGGIYEKDIFYDLCDQYGILVWQDFMFACAMYPGNREFLESVRSEAIQNVKRLRNHPSIALWCGDNENLSAWNRWGWKENVLKNQGQDIVDTVWKAYDDIIHNILPEVINEYDSGRLYWTSSPSSGFGELEDGKSGDMHYWGVWWGKEEFSKYEEVIPRFMSEFGFQSFPDINSVKKYTIEEDWNIYSEVMKSHQRSSIGNVTIKEYLLRDYKSPKNFEMFLYVGQLLQAKGIKTGIEAHRRNMPVCMGSLYWQLNDVWPVASWSGIDYYGRWKALHYAVKDAFKEIKISIENNSIMIKVYVISDHLVEIKSKLQLKVIEFNGNIISTYNKNINISSNTSQKYLEIELNNLFKGKNRHEVMITATLSDNENNILDNLIYYLVPPKELNLPSPSLDIDITKSGDEFHIMISTDVLAKNIYVNIPYEGQLSDNYFDLLPESNTVITFISNETITLGNLKSKINVYTLTDTY